MDSLRDMVVFARVVERRSFTGAAADLGVSKSAVSKQVSRLEDRLGARLLHRTTRKLSLTEAGSAFFERCGRILEEAQAAEEEVGELAAVPRGRLRVAAPMTFGVLHLATVMPDFLTGNPEISVDIDLDDRQVDLVRDGYDLAIRIGNLADSALVARVIAPSRHVICASPDYLARHGAPEKPSDLGRHNCFCYTYSSRVDEWQLRGPSGPEVVSVSGNLRSNNGDLLLQATLAGAGILTSPTFIVGGDIAAGRLVEVLPGYMLEDYGIYAVYAHRRHLLPKVRAFIDYLIERFGPDPYWDSY